MPLSVTLTDSNAHESSLKIAPPRALIHAGIRHHARRFASGALPHCRQALLRDLVRYQPAVNNPLQSQRLCAVAGIHATPAAP
jgi:hypothetical protein